MSKGLLKGLLVWTVCVLAACDRPVKLATSNPPAPAADSLLAAPQPNMPAEVVPEKDAALWPENLPLLAKSFQLQQDFQTFSGRAKVHYEGRDQSQDFNANIRIEKNKKIWLSINALGLLEVFRALLTPEGLQAINRLDKVYYDFPLSEASRILPVAADFQTVQSLLTGGILGKKGNVLQTLPAGNNFSVLLQRPDFQQALVLSGADTSLQEQSVLNQAAGLKLDITYERYKPTGNWNFPFGQTIRVTVPDNQVLLQLNFEKAVFNSEVDMPFSIPKKFKKAKLQE